MNELRNCDFYKTREEARAVYERIVGQLKPYMEFDVWLFQTYKPEEDELIYHCPIFDVMKAPEVQPNFRPIKIKSKDWVAVVIEKDDKFLMETQLRYGLGIKETEFPCGMVEDGESPLNAAYREVKEETGLDIPIGEFHSLGKYAANPAFMTNHMNYFYVNLDNVDFHIGETNFDEHEELTSFWKDKYEVRHELLNNENASIFMTGVFMLLHRFRYFKFDEFAE